LETEKGKEIMPRLGMRSQDELRTLDERLQKIAIKAISIIDFTIVEGRRTLERQKELFKTGKSKTMDSKHVTGDKPSLAMDIVPYIAGKGMVWDDLELFAHLIGVIKGVAYCEGIKIRCGYDWKDFPDYAHIQLV
jgi:peptidoglycan L-alanyl-D-glutamate endopeptidase CwlK